MSRVMRRQGRARHHGQALVEFAMIIPIFIVLLFGIIDLARFVYSTNSLNEVSREAARAGSVALRPDACTGLSRSDCVRIVARDRLVAVHVDTTDVSVVCQRKNAAGELPAATTTDNCGGSWLANDLMRVRITRSFGLLTPIVGQLVGNLQMEAEAMVTVNG